MKLASFRVPLNCTELQFLSKCASVGHLHQMCAGNEQDYDFFFSQSSNIHVCTNFSQLLI